MNSAELSTLFPTSSETPQWAEVRRIYRRICVLRATGKSDEAAVLEETELASALAHARVTADSDDSEAKLLADEGERVSNASAFAELLAPLLAERLRADLRFATPVTASPHSNANSAAAPAAQPARPLGSEVPGIADLIDGMLSQERFSPSPSHS